METDNQRTTRIGIFMASLVIVACMLLLCRCEIESVRAWNDETRYHQHFNPMGKQEPKP